ncbi:MAG TPA: hypothetical protein VFQ63_03970 [Patescibacteria group bacterium]|nr:hypothetical protein [Patescibacteria group bacterium]
MTTLALVTGYTRKILAISAMLLMGFLIIFGGVKLFFTIKEALYPTPPPPPTVSFGKLPLIAFPKNTPQGTYTYSLSTISGGLPAFPDRATIYQSLGPQPNLLGLTNARTMVANVGYSGDPTQVSDTDYSWTNQDSLPKKITINTQIQNFSVTSAYTSDQTVLAAAQLPDGSHATDAVSTYLQNLGLTPTDIDSSKTKVSLFAISNGQISPATSLSTAQIVRVDLFQSQINNLPVVYPQPTYSTMNFLLASSQNTDPQIVEAHFFHQSITSTSATYPIKTAKQAYEDLQNGKAYIASPSTTGNQVIIKNIFLAYYMSDSIQPYLQPVFVFSGDNNFVAYLPAITDVWVNN